MLYLLYLRLAEHHHYVPVLNLLRYLTFRTGMTVVTAQVVVVAMGSRFIRWMQAKQGKGQPIRKDGIERHVIEKAGTPTMGGLMILAGVLAGTLIWGDLASIYVWVAVVVTALFGLLGVLDDYAKVAKQTTAGVSGWARLAIEFAIAAGGVMLMIRFGPPQTGGAGMSTSLAFPIFKAFVINLGWFYLAFGGFVIVGAANAVNFTDGLDGLAIVPVMIAAAAFGVIAYLVGNHVFADYLQVHFVPGVGELAVFCGAMVGAALGFLWFNAPPAMVFMGDTGS
jgi:phospho-N-acetylmuramoyl-pentapeptide-transferase